MQKYWILCIVCFLVWCTVLGWLHLCAVNVEKRSSENLSSADIAVVLGNAVNRRGKLILVCARGLKQVSGCIGKVRWVNC